MRSFVVSAVLGGLLLAGPADCQWPSPPAAPGLSDAYCRSLGLSGPDLHCCVTIVDFKTTGETKLSSDVCTSCLQQGICPQSNRDFTKVDAKTDICLPGGKWDKVCLGAGWPPAAAEAVCSEA